LVNADIDVSDQRFLSLFSEALARVPKGVLPVRSVRKVRLRKRGTKAAFAGLTTYAPADQRAGRGSPSSGENERQTITFYTDVLDQLSDEASIAVMAHELAHAWLNEHVTPEESKRRERETDELASRWGFSRELGVLDHEAESL
jgi:hypothetical protein